MASRAVAANSGVATTILARVSRSSSPSSTPLYMVETGTATAPIRSRARIVIRVSGRSEPTIRTRSSGRTPKAWNPAATWATCCASSA